MDKGKNLPLAGGPYVSVDPETSIAVWSARARLIGIVKRVLPELIGELANEVFPLYINGGELAYEFWYERWEKAFDNWAAKFNIDFAWMRDQAFRTLEGWRTDPTSLKTREWSHLDYWRTVERASGFECDGWAPEIEPFDDYKKRVREEFKKFLANTKRNAPNFAAEKGLIPTQRQYSSQNLEWLVLYQFGGMSCGQIANKWGDGHEDWDGDASGVRKGVQAGARLLAINLRTDKTVTEAPTKLDLRQAMQTALDSDDTGAYIAAANSLDIAAHSTKPNGNRKTR